jgi:hypothetical protein
MSYRIFFIAIRVADYDFWQDDKYCLVVELPCHKTHRFDLDCVGPWLRLNGTCPLDRKDLMKKKEIVKAKAGEDPDEEDYESMYAWSATLLGLVPAKVGISLAEVELLGYLPADRWLCLFCLYERWLYMHEHGVWETWLSQ